jgi:hypothetical protein
MEDLDEQVMVNIEMSKREWKGFGNNWMGNNFFFIEKFAWKLNFLTQMPRKWDSLSILVLNIRT